MNIRKNLTPMAYWRLEIKICDLQNMSLETLKIVTSALQRFVVEDTLNKRQRRQSVYVLPRRIFWNVQTLDSLIKRNVRGKVLLV